MRKLALNALKSLGPKGGTLLLALGLLITPNWGYAHDIELGLKDVREQVARIEDMLKFYQKRSFLPQAPRSKAEQRRILGAAEIEQALGHNDLALRMLLGRLADPNFQAMREYVSTLLLTAEILERKGELIGAMDFAEKALQTGGKPSLMAEAGARWFRLARLTERMKERNRLFELWKAQGGAQASTGEVTAQVMYEAGFALRAQGEPRAARLLLAKVPSEAAVGSRAAYLAGTIFVEEGDLQNAERWFSAIMAWPLPDLPEDHSQYKTEKQLRQLAALSTGRLRYERGDLAGAQKAYALIPEGSSYQREACWERAYLELELGRRRGAMKQVQCVLDLGAQGVRQVDAKLFQASLQAHLNRYRASIDDYKRLHQEVVERRELFAAAVQQVREPAQFLFKGMERTAGVEGANATPGPATLLADAWNVDVDRAYRVDRGLDGAGDELSTLEREIAGITEKLQAEDAFAALDTRKENLRRLLREISHALGHAGSLADKTRHSHASLVYAEADHEHSSEAQEVQALMRTLERQQRQVHAAIEAAEKEAAQRKQQALSELQALTQQLSALRQEALGLSVEAQPVLDTAAKAALLEVLKGLDDAAMKAEVGVLDTYWLKKQHRTRSIEDLLQQKEESEQQVSDALREVDFEE